MSSLGKASEKAISQFTTLSQIVDQLKGCGYECEAGVLVNNVAFIALERMAEQEKKVSPHE